MDTRFEVSRLESLLESAKLLSASLELDDLLRHLLRTVMGRLLVMKAVIAITRDGRTRVSLARGVPAVKAGDPYTNAAGLPLEYPIGEGLGALAISMPPKGAPEGEEKEWLEALLGLAASSIGNAQAHDDTRRANAAMGQKNQELRALLDLGRGLAATIDPDEIAQLLGLTLAGRWALGKYAVATWKTGQAPVVRHKGLELPDLAHFAEHFAALPETGGFVEALEPSVHAAINAPPGSLLIPIRSGVETTGVVLCGPRLGGRAYTETDRDFGAGLAAQASVALENAWNFKETLAKKQIEKELDLAAGIQKDLFPKSLPALAHTEMAALNRPARQVGGDYYDALPMGEKGPEQPHLLTVVDISGKGISAALLMSNIQATLRALLSHEASLKAIAARTNDLLWASTPSNRYATAFFTLYEPVTGRCRYVNGGHCDGLVLRANGETELLSTTGLPVGLFPKREFDEAEVTLGGGDILLLYSDGVSEAEDSEQAQFGMERLTELLRETRHLAAAEILDRILAAIDAFAGAAPQHDDITALIVKRLPGRR